MPAIVHEADIEKRLARLEGRFEQLVGSLDMPAAPRGSAPAEQRSHASPAAPRQAPAAVERARLHRGGTYASIHDRRRQPLSDIVGGRLLAWLGGIATLVGIVLFLALAVSRGWIGQDARVLIAGTVSSGLMVAGGWLHAHRGRTEAARAMVGAAAAALYCTLIVASQVYHLIPAMLALLLSFAVGAVATTLAIRWAGRAVAGLGLIGALISPVLVGASMNAATVALLAFACACAMAVAIRQRWSWLGLLSAVVCAPQWGSWLLEGQSVPVDLIVLGAFAALGLIGAVGAHPRADETRLARGPAALAALSACLVAVVGHVVLQDASGRAAAELWLAALAAAHVVLGVCRFRRLPIGAGLREVLIAIGVVLADAAFALGAGGVTLVLGWAGAAMGFAWLARRTTPGSSTERLVGLGLGAHVGLTLTRALIDAPPSTLGSGEPALLSLVSLSVLAGSCIASARLVGDERTAWSMALEGLGLAASAYLTAAALNGPALTCAWCAEAVALSRLPRVAGEKVARYGGLVFLALAVAQVLIAEAPPPSLVTGAGDLGAAALALGATASAAFWMARAQDGDHRLRRWLFAGATAALLYLASVAIVTGFQPGADAGPESILDLSVRQEGQVLLSILWSGVGLAALIVGLRRKHAAVRSLALGWLMVTVAKVFLYDLSTLSSIYRVASFIALGLLLLAGAYAYQRLRPPPLPDMREVHPSQL